MKTSKTNKLTNLLGLYLLIALVALGVLGYFVIGRTLTAAKQHKVERQQVTANIKSLEELEIKTNELRSNYDQVKGQRDIILNLLPNTTEEEELLALLSNLASDSGVLLGNFEPEGTASGMETATSYSVYPVSINILGTYETIFGTNTNTPSFLNALEKGARFIDVVSTTVSADNNSESINVRLSLHAYYRNVSEPAEGTATEVTPSE